MNRVKIEMCVVSNFRLSYAAPSRDFVSLKNLSLGVFSDSRQRHCFEVEIMNDKVVESYEEFTVHLRAQENSDSYYPQAIDPDTAIIRILDNDCKSGSNV